jgi:membrane complex biogenesis BtpA family protein
MITSSLGFGSAHPIIGVIHLLPLPGAPKFAGDTGRIIACACADAATLENGGVDAILIENFGDTPFFPTVVTRETIAWMSRIGGLVRDAVDIPLGVCVLRNDARAALAIAHCIDAHFIRVCILGSPRVTDQGLIEGAAFDLLRDRARLGADIKIFADVDIKHSYPLAASFSLKADADALIVTGAATGVSISQSHLSVLRGQVSVPVFVGSGVTDTSVAELSSQADGFIVGTAFKDGTGADARIDADKVRSMVAQLRP